MSNANTKALGTVVKLTPKRRWLVERPGVISRIAKELGVTQPFVSDVFHGRRKSRSGDVEKKLAELGAPGF